MSDETILSPVPETYVQFNQNAENGSPFANMPAPLGAVPFDPRGTPVPNMGQPSGSPCVPPGMYAGGDVPVPVAQTPQMLSIGQVGVVQSQSQSRPSMPQEVEASGNNGNAAQPLTNEALFTMADLVPSPPIAKEFLLQGRTWRIVFSAAARTDAQAFVQLMQTLSVKDKPPLTINRPGSVPFLVSDPVYRSSLEILAATVIEPAWTVDMWAIMGKKLSPPEMDSLVQFATEINGLTDLAKAEDKKRAGEGLSQDGLTTG